MPIHTLGIIAFLPLMYAAHSDCLSLLLAAGILLSRATTVAAQAQRRPPNFSDYDLSNATRYPKVDIGRDEPPTIEEVSESSPRLFLIHNALTPDECRHLRDVAGPTLRQSYVGTAGQGMKIGERRTSQSTFLIKGSVLETKEMKSMRRRIADLTGFDLRRFADLQVNRYEAGGKYEPHVDWARSEVSEQEWTVLLCLSSVAYDQGGETVFPRANVMVQPKEGMAIVFKNSLGLHVLDHDSLHGGAPLKYGEKWNCNQWIFAQDVHFARRVSLPLILMPWGGDPPKWLVLWRNHLMKTKGEAAGYMALNKAANIALGVVSCAATAALGGIFRVVYVTIARMRNGGFKDWESEGS
jgi:prolyl 4-hydroxylase